MGLFKKILFLKPSLLYVRYRCVTMDLWIVNGDCAGCWSNKLCKFDDSLQKL